MVPINPPRIKPYNPQTFQLPSGKAIWEYSTRKKGVGPVVACTTARALTYFPGFLFMTGLPVLAALRLAIIASVSTTSLIYLQCKIHEQKERQQYEKEKWFHRDPLFSKDHPSYHTYRKK